MNIKDQSEALPQAVSREDMLAQLLNLAERVAMLHYHFAKTAVEELGQQKGRELVAKAIASYGREVGEQHRERVKQAGYEPTCGNYAAVPDLPRLPWSPDGMPETSIHGKRQRVCPLAKYWIEKGAEDLGRLYCYVDQAKYAAFDPECECRHPENVLDGDNRCLIVVKKQYEWLDSPPQDQAPASA